MRSKSSWTVSVKNYRPTSGSHCDVISIKVLPLKPGAVSPTLFPMPEARLELRFMDVVLHVFCFHLNLLDVIKLSPLQLQLHLREQEEATGC